jgi:hypothetical protein
MGVDVMCLLIYDNENISFLQLNAHVCRGNMFKKTIALITNLYMDTVKGIVETLENIPAQTKEQLLCLRNYAMNGIVKILQPRNVHSIWEVDFSKTSNMLRYNIYESPFQFRYGYTNLKSLTSLEIPVKLLPEWFTFTDNGDRAHKEKSYAVSMTNKSLYFSRTIKSDPEDLFILQKRVPSENPRFLEIRLCGEKGSVFLEHYPLGVDITCFGNILFNREVSDTRSCVQLYEVFPFILYHIHEGEDVVPYEKESLYVTLLEDDTFEVYRDDWCDDICHCGNMKLPVRHRHLLDLDRRHS